MSLDSDVQQIFIRRIHRGQLSHSPTILEYDCESKDLRSWSWWASVGSCQKCFWKELVWYTGLLIKVDAESLLKSSTHTEPTTYSNSRVAFVLQIRRWTEFIMRQLSISLAQGDIVGSMSHVALIWLVAILVSWCLSMDLFSLWRVAQLPSSVYFPGEACFCEDILLDLLHKEIGL